jgi:predicted nucleic acid-binding protein
MATKYSTQNISEICGRRVFFDANVLIYIFWPSGSYRWEAAYSSAFGQLLRQSNELFVDFIVISEVVNRTIRLSYDNYLRANDIQKSDLTFKQYRNSSDGKAALSDIYLIVETNILNTFTVVGRTFTKTEIQSFLTADSLDFSDKGILLTCKDHAFVLLTNDIDYKMASIDLLTSNPAILRN